MRFLKVVQEKAPDRLEASTDKLYEVVFENKVEVSDNIAGVLGSLSPAPFEASALEEYVRLSSSTETKERVKQDAERLVAEGAFGFPWLEVCKPDGQRLTIFGSDRFEFLADWWATSFPFFQQLSCLVHLEITDSNWQPFYLNHPSAGSPKYSLVQLIKAWSRMERAQSICGASKKPSLVYLSHSWPAI
ncbi:hypothetical protein PtA15_4A168 [Puccinia triticina]|uniref:DSBA-like thioredoxin domain-containing protein n=1 Tax=Puccinia triticina TaxID=208348 RepID=A0ABY7CIT4_9BASI|nr:uncharacterized protein PtA15_4A168 [Puccinia triticina]WAQ83720.1 hypothetical protein PtA15_4A168 [Puccinia triticina]